MTKDIATCHAELNLAVASALMWQHGCGALPVAGPKGELTGMVTDRDICLALGSSNVRASELKVADILHGSVFFCAGTDDIRSALKRMRERRVRRLPVVDEDLRVEGILSLHDLVWRAAPDCKKSEISYTDVIGALQSIYPRRPAAMAMSAA